MADIREFPTAKVDRPTLEPMAVERVLDKAKHLERVIVIGYDAEGDLYAAASHSDTADNILLLELTRALILKNCVKPK